MIVQTRRYLLQLITGGVIMVGQGAQAFTARPVAITGDRFALGGVEYRLCDIMAPDLHHPYADQSRLMLQRMLHQQCSLTFEPVMEDDRWGRKRVLARCWSFHDRHLSLQAALVAAGAARVFPQSSQDDELGALLDREMSARKNRHGLWALKEYAVASADAANHTVGGVHVVEGSVLSVYRGSGRAFINFGTDYKTDFTVTLSSTSLRRWTKKRGFSLEAMVGRRLRVRGFVEWINGPSLEWRHWHQVEFLGGLPWRSY